jgi:hypothetical protein
MQTYSSFLKNILKNSFNVKNLAFRHVRCSRFSFYWTWTQFHRRFAKCKSPLKCFSLFKYWFLNSGRQRLRSSTPLRHPRFSKRNELSSWGIHTNVLKEKQWLINYLLVKVPKKETEGPTDSIGTNFASFITHSGIKRS